MGFEMSVSMEGWELLSVCSLLGYVLWLYAWALLKQDSTWDLYVFDMNPSDEEQM